MRLTPSEKLLLGLTGLALLYFCLGPIVIVTVIGTAGGFAFKTIADVKTRKTLIERALTGQDVAEFIALEQQGFKFSDSQKLATLLNAYKHKNFALINQLATQNFKIDFATLFNCFRQNYDLGLLKLLREKFLQQSQSPSAPLFNSLFRILITHKTFDQIEAFLLVYPREMLKELLSYLNKKNANSPEIYEFLSSKKEWLITNINLVNYVISDQTDGDLINFMMDIFPDSELHLHHVFIRLTDQTRRNDSLENRILQYMQKAEKTELFYLRLQEIIKHTIYIKRLDLSEKILEENPSLLVIRQAFASELLFNNSGRSKVSGLLLRYGADVNATNSEGLSVLEQSIHGLYTAIPKKQKMFDLYTKHGVNLNQQLKDAPQKRTDMTLLGYLPFLNLRVRSNPAYEAIKLQKFLALFLEIPGESNSNGSLCKHSYMQDSQAYWNFLLDLYFDHLISQGLMDNFSAEFCESYNNCLKAIYSEEGHYNTKSLYQDYCAGKPILLPVYLHDHFGGQHIATLGVLKTGPDSQLVVEADRGFGRHDFSVFNQPCFNYDKFYKYAGTKNAKLSVYTWQDHHSPAKFRVEFDKQNDDFCPAISAKFAFKIAFFLNLVRQDPENSDLNSIYELTENWYKEFYQRVQARLLTDYRAIEEKYIDKEFLQKAEASVEKLSAVELPEPVEEQPSMSSFRT